MDVVQAFIDTYTGQKVEDIERLVHLVKENVSMNFNELGLVYHPMKMEETFHDKLYDGNFVGYNEEELE